MLLILVDYVYICIMFSINSVGITTVGQVNDTIVREGNTTTITCEAFGYPPPTIVWSRLDGNLSDRVSMSDSVSVPTGYGNVTRVSMNLTITNASREDTGEYICSANNSAGRDNSSVHITIHCKFGIMIISHVTILLTSLHACVWTLRS